MHPEDSFEGVLGSDEGMPVGKDKSISNLGVS